MGVILGGYFHFCRVYSCIIKPCAGEFNYRYCAVFRQMATLARLIQPTALLP